MPPGLLINNYPIKKGNAKERLFDEKRNDYSEIKGFTVRNMQYVVQFFNEYNQNLTMVKDCRPISQSAIMKSLISQLDEYNFTQNSISIHIGIS